MLDRETRDVSDLGLRLDLAKTLPPCPYCDGPAHIGYDQAYRTCYIGCHRCGRHQSPRLSYDHQVRAWTHGRSNEKAEGLR